MAKLPLQRPLRASAVHRWAALACAAAFLGACSDPARPEPEPRQEHDFVRLHMSLPAPELWEVTGPMVVVNDAVVAEANWASLRSGTVGGTAVRHWVSGNRQAAGDPLPGLFDWWLHPNMDHPGTFRPGDCQATTGFQNCARIRLRFGKDFTYLVEAIPDSVVVTITEYGLNQVRGSFRGRFLYTPANGSPTPVDVTGDAEVARYRSR